MDKHHVEFQLPVYSFHIDSNQNVNNIVFVQWVEIARLRMMEQAGYAVETLDAKGFMGVVTETCIRYRKPMSLYDEVTIQLWIREMRRISVLLAYRFFNGEQELVAEGTQEALFVSLETGRPYRISAEERAPFERFVLVDGPDTGL
ncbi:MAG: acyl-CoA thioesterase [Gammaproteobacteria bacterium]|nr:MAG: acyl-CoA thioesterase [Gammaproteobacteria bacterium]